MMLIILIIVCYIFTSCQDKQRQEIARLVQEWQGKEIVFPSHLVFTRYAKDTIWHDWQQADLKVFVYVVILTSDNGTTTHGVLTIQ